MKELKIAAVSYLNTFPFVFGLTESGILEHSKLELAVPKICAEKLKSGAVDIALVPVGALADFDTYHFVSDLCIGAQGKVKTVLLLSRVPLDRINHVNLDFDSRTSVILVRILAGMFWHIQPVWKQLKQEEANHAVSMESLVAIGDKTFEIRQHYPYVYDLAEEWSTFTGLPFVFAVWISKKKLPERILSPFRQALAWGVDHKSECLDFFKAKLPAHEDCLSYLEKNISYELDETKHQALGLFLKYMKQLTIDP